jgi:hypothetical protein
MKDSQKKTSLSSGSKKELNKLLKEKMDQNAALEKILWGVEKKSGNNSGQ